MDEPKGNRRARRRSLAILLAPIAALAGVLAVLGAGVAPARLRPVAIDLAFAAVASILYFAITYVSKRRARRLRGTEVPWGVRLRKPIWLSTPEMTIPLELGGLLAALVALVGFPGIGAGVLVTFLILSSMMPLMAFGASTRALTFETEGLRIEMRHVTFVIPWASLTRSERIGPEHTNMTMLGLADTEAIVATAVPATPEARARVANVFADITNRGPELMLMSWTGGLDGRTLRRALDAARSGAGRHVN
jgi:hypothetical protein